MPGWKKNMKNAISIRTCNRYRIHPVCVCVPFRHILKGPRQKIETENKIKSRRQRAELLHAQCDEYKRRKIRMKRASKGKRMSRAPIQWTIGLLVCPARAIGNSQLGIFHRVPAWVDMFKYNTNKRREERNQANGSSHFRLWLVRNGRNFGDTLCRRNQEFVGDAKQTRRLNQKNLLEKCPPVGPVQVAGPSFRGKGDGQ